MPNNDKNKRRKPLLLLPFMAMIKIELINIGKINSNKILIIFFFVECVIDDFPATFLGNIVQFYAK